MHTAEQAKELWCPMVRRSQTVVVMGYKDEPAQTFHASGINTASSRHHEPVFETVSCIANQCAMWRWHPTTVLHPHTGELTMLGPGGVTDQIPAKGYCGLAGKPAAL